MRNHKTWRPIKMYIIALTNNANCMRELRCQVLYSLIFLDHNDVWRSGVMLALTINGLSGFKGFLTH